jgi:hypothetical protein
LTKEGLSSPIISLISTSGSSNDWIKEYSPKSLGIITSKNSLAGNY